MLAISAASVIRLPNGILLVMVRSFSSGFGNVATHFLYCGVITSAGTIAFTRIP